MNPPTAHRVFLCDVVEVDTRGPRLLGRQLQVLLSPDLEPRWLHAADTVGIPSAPMAAEVFARLPGCRAVVALGPSPAVHLRDGGPPLPVPDAVTAGIIAALADVRPLVPHDPPIPSAVVSGVRDRPCTAGTPTASAVLRLRGRTVRCEWRALR